MFPGCHNKVAQTRWLETAGVYSLTGEATSWKSRCQQSWFLLRTLKNMANNFGIPWLIDGSSPYLHHLGAETPCSNFCFV